MNVRRYRKQGWNGVLAVWLSFAAWSATAAFAQSQSWKASPLADLSPAAVITAAAQEKSPPPVITAAAQEKLPPPVQVEKSIPLDKPLVVEPLVGGPLAPFMGGPGGCCNGSCPGGACFPGHPPCCGDCVGNTCAGRFLCGLYHSLCCPDPCYEPCWIPTQNAAFFADPVRPWTQTRLRVDNGQNFRFPDIGEFFLASTNGKGRGPAVPGGLTNTNYNQVSFYQEIAPTKRFSFFFELTGLGLYGDGHGGGFGDMNLGTKTVLCDSELLLLSFQFRTYLPTGNVNAGLGTGHVSLEPSLLAALKLRADTYLQLQAGEWFPIAGDHDAAGPVFEFHASLNQVIYRFLPDVPLIGTLELNDYTFQGGAYTAGLVGGPPATLLTQSASGRSIASAGPGLRLSVCNRLDFGCAAAFGFTDFGPRELLYRAEVRWRY